MTDAEKNSASNGARAAARGRFCGQRIFRILKGKKSQKLWCLKIFWGYSEHRNVKRYVKPTSYFDLMHFGAIFRFLTKFEFL